jgi:hypothetical protein
MKPNNILAYCENKPTDYTDLHKFKKNLGNLRNLWASFFHKYRARPRHYEKHPLFCKLKVVLKIRHYSPLMLLR